MKIKTISGEEISQDISFNEERERKEFDKQIDQMPQKGIISFNDDLMFIIITHILSVGIVISSGYHSNHFATGKVRLL